MIICLLTYVKVIIIQNDKDRNIPSIDKFINVLMKNSYLFNDKLSFKFEEAFTLMINKLTLFNSWKNSLSKTTNCSQNKCLKTENYSIHHITVSTGALNLVHFND